jgi:16S rRNA (cytidine1402-2'-O)-methyltransferase
MAGTLFVVATPIGNLEDVTLRALRILREVDVIAAEDTRRTAKLLAHYEIRKPLTSVREHNEARAAAALIGRMERGASVALVSDAGTPGISDPGARLVAAARERGIPVIPIPGPSAVAAAISIAGFPLDEFVFMGFPPHGGSARAEWLHRIETEPRPAVFFEAPHRIHRTLSELGPRLVDRQILVGRELTKIHEYSVVQPIAAGFGEVPAKGEFVLVVGPGQRDRRETIDAEKATGLVDVLVRSGQLQEHDAVQLLSRSFSVNARDLTKAIKKFRISVKQQSRSSS